MSSDGEFSLQLFELALLKCCHGLEESNEPLSEFIRPQEGYLDPLAPTPRRAVLGCQRRLTLDVSSEGEISLELYELPLLKCSHELEESIEPLSVTIRPQEGYLDPLAPSPMRAVLGGQRRLTLGMSSEGEFSL